MGGDIFSDILNDWPYWCPIPIGIILIAAALFPMRKKFRFMFIGAGLSLFIVAWILTNFY